MPNKKEDTFFSLILFTIVTSTLVILTTNCHRQSSTPEKPHYINQSEYDSISYMTFQERDLVLNLTNKNPSKLSNQRFNVGTSWQQEKTKEYHFDKNGAFIKKLTYGESRLDVCIPGKSLSVSSSIDSICYSWFYPNQWFQSLNLEIFTDSLQAIYTADSLGKFTLTITYPPYLKPLAADGSFGHLLGIQLDLSGDKDPKKDYYWIKEQSPGKLVMVANVPYFFEQYANSYTTPYQIGDHYTLYASLTLAIPQGLPYHKLSSKKDLPYKPKLYTSGYITRGNPYATIGPSTPSYQIRIDISKDIILTKAHL